MPSYKYDPSPKWRLTYFNKDTNKLMEKEFRSYGEIREDDVWNKFENYAKNNLSNPVARPSATYILL